MSFVFMAVAAGLLLSSCFGSTCDRRDFCSRGALHSCSEEQSLLGGWMAVWDEHTCEHGCVEPTEEHHAYCRPADGRDPRCGSSVDRHRLCDGPTLLTCWNGYAIDERVCGATELCDVHADCVPMPPPDPRLYCPQEGDASFDERVYTCADDDTQIVCLEGAIQNAVTCPQCYDRERGGDWFACY